MTPSWYDVLGVDADADAAEIRAAWQQAIAGLDPTDRRFKQRNRAAEVLLDPRRRAAHDADLAADPDDDDDEDELAGAPDQAEAPEPVAARPVPPRLAKESATGSVSSRPSPPAAPVAPAPPAAPAARAGAAVPVGRADRGPADSGASQRQAPWLTVALGIVATALVVITMVAVARGGETAAAEGGGSGSSSSGESVSSDLLPDAASLDAARAAAEVAIVPVLAYDYRNLERSKQAALSFLTTSYGAEYRRNFEGVIQPNARRTRTIVNVEVITSAIARVEPDSVDVLLFVNRPTRNAVNDQVYRDQVTARMVDVEGTWLVDCLITMPDGVCGV